MMLPFLMLFSTFLILSTLFLMLSSNWLLIWAALELNLLSIIPLLNLSSTFQELESSLKYFLSQALGSSGLIMSIFVLSHQMPQNCDSMMNFFTLIPIILVMSLLLKLGVSPLHFWFPSVMASSNWPMALILTTWQKIAPIYMLTSMYFSTFMNKMILISAAFSALVGGVMGLNQTQLRALLAYSSIGHVGWMLCAMSFSSTVLIFYLFIYFISTIPIFLMFKKNGFTSTKFFNSMKLIPMLSILSILLLSLAGLPPLLGFMPKWAVFFFLIKSQNILILILLILGTLMNIFYYLLILMSSFYTSYYNHHFSTHNYSIFYMNFISPLIMISLPLLTTFLIILYALIILNKS